MKFKISSFEVKKIGEDKWQKASEKMVLEKLMDHFDPISPVLMKMLQGNEITTHQEIYRMRS